MKITKTLNVYYQDYSLMEEKDKIFITTGSAPQNEKMILLESCNYLVEIPDFINNPELLKIKQISVLQEQQRILREATLKELQDLEERIQKLKGIEYITAVSI